VSCVLHVTQAILATSDEGVHALSLFWRRFKLFLPIWGEPRRLTKEVGVHVSTLCCMLIALILYYLLHEQQIALSDAHATQQAVTVLLC
jgi:hypothetical protein